MLLTEFIKSNDDWEKILSAPPYCIKIKRDAGYIIFSYNQLESDFGNPLVLECRGVILDEATFKPVCVPFYKFGNYGESYAQNIDWKSARVQEKIDGSMIKVWHDRDAWHISTNGSIFACNAELDRTVLFGEDCPYKTHADLFDAAIKSAGLDFDILDKNCTYMFELVSPYNKVVIMYDSIDIYHTGTRNNITLEEFDADIGIKKPAELPICSLQDCISSALKLPADKEGYVVVDKYYHRVKVKNPAYVALHHFKNNGAPTLINLIAVVRKNETEEFLTYFPEFIDIITSCESKINGIIADMERTVESLRAKTFESQKDFALEVKDKPLSGYYFKWRQNPELTPKVWFWKMTDEKIKLILNNLG